MKRRFGAGGGAKVFCFFLSKKKALLAYARLRSHYGQVMRRVPRFAGRRRPKWCRVVARLIAPPVSLVTPKASCGNASSLRWPIGTPPVTAGIFRQGVR